jgi:hypothetical protein
MKELGGSVIVAMAAHLLPADLHGHAYAEQQFQEKNMLHWHRRNIISPYSGVNYYHPLH